MLRAQEENQKLHLIRGERGHAVVVVSGESLLQSIQKMPQADAMRVVIDQANSHIHRSGLYRVERLFIPGDVTIYPLTGPSGWRYQVVVRNEKHRVLIELTEADMGHAILDLLSFWEEEEPTLGPSIS